MAQGRLPIARLRSAPGPKTDLIRKPIRWLMILVSVIEAVDDYLKITG
jgi:hypothetical protein